MLYNQDSEKPTIDVVERKPYQRQYCLLVTGTYSTMLHPNSPKRFFKEKEAIKMADR